MTADEFVDQVTRSGSEFLQTLLSLLDARQIEYCAIDGLAVNAYAEPVVSLDLDLVVVANRIEDLAAALAGQFKLTRFPHGLNVSSADSDLRVQIQTDPRYQPFVARSTRKTVLGRELRVAAIEDVLQGKIWAYSDPERRASKRQKDLADILRLLEAQPGLKERLPDDVRSAISRVGG